MSKSRRTATDTRNPSQPRADATRAKQPVRPRPKHGRAYGLMSNAAHDIAAWALELAARDVADWPEGERRVRNARKFVLAYVRGKEPRSFPTEDIEFTARLLARIFDDELRIGVANIIQILDDLGLPTDEVPLERRRPVGASIRSASMPVEPVIPLRPFSSYAAPALASQRGCDECNPLCPRFRNAA